MNLQQTTIRMHLKVKKETINDLNSNLILIYTGLHRFSNNVEKDKLKNIERNIKHLDKIKNLTLDLRKESRTYGLFETTLLSDKNKNKLFIPKGFAHGFIVLSESAIVSYKVDNYYDPNYESGVLWNDTDLNIYWKIILIGLHIGLSLVTEVFIHLIMYINLMEQLIFKENNDKAGAL